MTTDKDYDLWGLSSDSVLRDPLVSDNFHDESSSHSFDLGGDFFDEMPHSSKTLTSSSENIYSPLSDNTYHIPACENELGTASSPSSCLFNTDTESSNFETDFFGLDDSDFCENNVQNDFDFWDRENYFCPTTSQSPTPKSDVQELDFISKVTQFPKPLVEMPSPNPKIETPISPVSSVVPLSSRVPLLTTTTSSKLPLSKSVVVPKPAFQTTLVTTTPVVRHVAVGNRRVINGPRIVRLPASSSNVRPQRYHVPCGTRFIRLTRVSAETPVYEAIRAAGIGTTPVKRFRAPEQPKILRPVIVTPHSRHQADPSQEFITRRVVPRVFRRKFVLVRRKNPNAGEIIENTVLPTPQFDDLQTQKHITHDKQPEKEESDSDWDMPVLTREAPFKPEQLPPSVQSHSTFHHVCTPVYNNNFDERLQCHVCYKIMINRHALAKHMHTHETPRFKCTYCSRLFYDRTKLRRHLVVHGENLRMRSQASDSELPFRCIECGQSFTKLIHLQNHLRIHTTRKNLPLLDSL